MGWRPTGPRDTVSLLFKLLAAGGIVWAVVGLLDQNGTALVSGILAAVVFIALDVAVSREQWLAGEAPPEEVIEEREPPFLPHHFEERGEPDRWPESPPPTVVDERRNRP
jgi:hypothetical protein